MKTDHTAKPATTKKPDAPSPCPKCESLTRERYDLDMPPEAMNNATDQRALDYLLLAEAVLWRMRDPENVFGVSTDYIHGNRLLEIAAELLFDGHRYVERAFNERSREPDPSA
jgi:hypothetical protein